MALRNVSLEKVCSLYFTWKDINTQAKDICTRGVNLHEAVTEGAVCLVNGYSTETYGSEDAIDVRTNNKIQVKGTSNFDKDLTSFGPRSQFDELHFVRIDSCSDFMYFYRIPVDNLNYVMVNKKETFRQQQLRGVRPRFSIIKKYIERFGITEYATLDLSNGVINYVDGEDSGADNTMVMSCQN